MLIVHASAKPSPIHNIGLFADERIGKGTVTWRFDARLDLLFDQQDVQAMPEQQQKFLDKYAYLSTCSGKYVFSTDDSRFTNHSTNNNVDSLSFPESTELCGVANRDIEVGEEILADYRMFDAHDATSTDDYLSLS